MCRCKLIKGFSLIELMIVIAIIGILAAVAVPTYKEYIYKSRLAEVVNTLNATQSSISLYLAEAGILTTTGSCTNLDYASTSTDLIESVVVDNNCVVKITSQASPFGGTAQKVTSIPLLSGSGMVWQCRISAKYSSAIGCAAITPEEEIVSGLVEFGYSFTQQVEDYYLANGTLPPEFLLPPHDNLAGNSRWRGDFIELDITVPNAGGQLALYPSIDTNGQFTWVCGGASYAIPCSAVPIDCQSGCAPD